MLHVTSCKLHNKDINQFNYILTPTGSVVSSEVSSNDDVWCGIANLSEVLSNVSTTDILYVCVKRLKCNISDDMYRVYVSYDPIISSGDGKHRLYKYTPDNDLKINRVLFNDVDISSLHRVTAYRYRLKLDIECYTKDYEISLYINNHLIDKYQLDLFNNIISTSMLNMNKEDTIISLMDNDDNTIWTHKMKYVDDNSITLKCDNIPLEDITHIDKSIVVNVVPKHQVDYIQYLYNGEYIDKSALTIDGTTSFTIDSHRYIITTHKYHLIKSEYNNNVYHIEVHCRDDGQYLNIGNIVSIRFRKGLNTLSYTLYSGNHKISLDDDVIEQIVVPSTLKDNAIVIVIAIAVILLLLLYSLKRS
jgi:hypothetical protein